MPTTKTKATDIRSGRRRAAKPQVAHHVIQSWVEGSDSEDYIELTRDELDALKEHLNSLRLAKTEIPESAVVPRIETADRRAKREAETRDRAAELQRVREFLDLDEGDLEMIELVKKLKPRTFCGVDDPMAKFIIDLLHHYIWAEDNGKGMTVEDVESELEDLRQNMAEAISEAYFIGDRYPRPEGSGA